MTDEQPFWRVVSDDRVRPEHAAQDTIPPLPSLAQIGFQIAGLRFAEAMEQHHLAYPRRLYVPTQIRLGSTIDGREYACFGITYNSTICDHYIYRPASCSDEAWRIMVWLEAVAYNAGIRPRHEKMYGEFGLTPLNV